MSDCTVPTLSWEAVLVRLCLGVMPFVMFTIRMLTPQKLKSFLDKSRKREWKYLLRHEDCPDQIFRTYNPEQKSENATDALILIYLAVGYAGLEALIKLPVTIYAIPIWLGIGALFILLSQIQLFERRRQREERGRKTEEAVAGELLKSFKNHGVALYSALALEHSVSESDYFDSRLYVEGKQDLDIFAVFPTGVSFKILVTSLADARITFNEKNETLRYTYDSKNRGKIEPNPLKEILSSEEWLLEKRPQIVRDSSTKILIFVGARIAHHNEYLYESCGERRFLRAWREGQPVYVVTTKEELCTLIETKLNP